VQWLIKTSDRLRWKSNFVVRPSSKTQKIAFNITTNQRSTLMINSIRRPTDKDNQRRKEAFTKRSETRQPTSIITLIKDQDKFETSWQWRTNSEQDIQKTKQNTPKDQIWKPAQEIFLRARLWTWMKTDSLSYIRKLIQYKERPIRRTIQPNKIRYKIWDTGMNH